MKFTWGVLCVALLAVAPVAFCDEATSVVAPTPSATAPTTATAVSAPTSPKLTWPASTGATHRLKQQGVPNFGKLNDYIWRSGQPSREGYQQLAAAGLKTVINFREEFPQDKDRIPQGVHYVYIPIKNDYTPTEAQTKLFMDTVSNPDNWPVLIHCAAGEGRAGTMSALVRHALDGWKHDEIMKEVCNYWSRSPEDGKIPLAKRQQDFIQRWEESVALPPKS